MPRFLRQPLLAFLLCGVGLFYLYGLVGGGDNQSETRIEVDRESLLTFLQFRAKRFDAQWAASHLDSLAPQQLEDIIAQYVREEALFREAKLMQLARDDYIIKQRLIQKVEYIAQGVSDSLIEVNDGELEAYFEDNRDNYRVEATVTFTHIFFETSRGAEQAKRQAEQQLELMTIQPVRFDQAGRYGDRFLYHTNYVARDQGFVAAHFGEPMAAALFQLQADATDWQGPLQSSYGYHLVLLAESQPARVPDFQEVASRVRADLLREKKRQLTASAIDAIVAGYPVVRAPELQRAAKKPQTQLAEAAE